MRMLLDHKIGKIITPGTDAWRILFNCTCTVCYDS